MTLSAWDHRCSLRGYLSRYARFLDLPESAVLDRYRQQAAASQEPPPLKVVHAAAADKLKSVI
jgi:cytoskeletal protein RodZ